MKAERSNRTSKRNQLKSSEVEGASASGGQSLSPQPASGKSSEYSLDERLERKRRERELAKAASSSPVPDAAPTAPVAKRWPQAKADAPKASSVLGTQLRPFLSFFLSLPLALARFHCQGTVSGRHCGDTLSEASNDRKSVPIMMWMCHGACQAGVGWGFWEVLTDEKL